jgi:ribonuclease VapC
VTAVMGAFALLAFLQGEPGADADEGELAAGGATCGAANWSDVAQQVRAAGRNWDLSRALLTNYAVTVGPVTEADAEWAAPGGGRMKDWPTDSA